MVREAHPTAADRPSEGLPGAGHVLVIEDEAAIRETVEVLIGIEGCEVRTAANGTRALEIIQEWPPDLILLDLTLPGMSGEEFISAYHGTPGPHAPIVLMTGWELSRAQLQALGVAGLIPKPFEVTDLLQVVAGFTDCADS
jgi:CheY-like chemotaxis protein